MDYLVTEDLDERKHIKNVEKGSRLYVDRIKFVRERGGIGLREAKDLCDHAPGLTAGEIVERYRANRASGISIDKDALPTIAWRVHGCKYPELDGFYTEMSESLKGLIAGGGGYAFELTSKGEALSQMHIMAHLAPIKDVEST